MGAFSVINSLNFFLGGSGSFKGIAIDLSFWGGSEPCFEEVGIKDL